MVTVNSGKVTTFDDTVGLKRDCSELITMLSPTDVPMLMWLPGLQDACTQTKHEWLEDEIAPLASTVGAAAIDDSSTTLPVATGTGKYFRPDDVLKVEDEVFIVASVSGDNLTLVARGHGSTSAAAHAADKVVQKIGVARPEGSDAGEPIFTDKTADYNYTQIFEDTVKVTGTREAIAEYGVANQYARNLMKVMKYRAIAVEQAIIHGVRNEDTTNLRRTMGGFLEFCSVNSVDASGAAVSKALLNDITQDIWRAGGEPRTLIMNIDQKSRLYDIYANQIRTRQDERGVGGAIDYFENDLGRFDILLDRWVPRDKILVVDRDKVGFGPLKGRNWTHEYLGKKGDYRHGVVLGEFTMEVRGRAAHGVINNLAI